MLVSVGVPAVLASDRVEIWVSEVLVDDDAEVTVLPPGFRADAVAVLVTVPLFTSAWVIVYVPVQVVAAPGARVVAGQVTALSRLSLTATVVSVAVPVLVTRKL